MSAAGLGNHLAGQHPRGDARSRLHVSRGQIVKKARQTAGAETVRAERSEARNGALADFARDFVALTLCATLRERVAKLEPMRTFPARRNRCELEVLGPLLGFWHAKLSLPFYRANEGYFYPHFLALATNIPACTRRARAGTCSVITTSVLVLSASLRQRTPWRP